MNCAGLPMRRLLPSLSIILIAGFNPAHALQPMPEAPPLVAEARKSVAWLMVYKDDRQFRATGFVVARPSDGKKIILTAGHIFQSGMTLTARLPGTARPVPCDLIAVSGKHDLMAVSPTIPIDAPALPLLSQDDPQPKLDDPVLVIGCPGGLDWAHYKGQINGQPMSAADLDKLLAPADSTGRRTPHGDAIVLRHNAFSMPGMSGSPILDTRGRVIGVQLGTLPKASNVSFSIHARHIADLDLQARPRPFVGGPALDSDIGHVLSAADSVKQPFVIRIGDQDVDARCLSQGYLPRDAEALTRRYIQDQEQFARIFSGPRLQKLLDDTPIAQITNPAFGFRVLVPKSYTYRIERLERPQGIIVTFISDDPTVASPFNTITMRAFLNTNYYLLAKRRFDASVESGNLSCPEEFAEDPFRRAAWQQGLINGYQIGFLTSTFPHEFLGISVREQNGKVVGLPERQVFQHRQSIMWDPLNTSWVRSNYDAEDGKLAHAVRIGYREGVFVVIHYEFLQKDREQFFKGGEPGRNFVERAFIAASVSLY